MWYEAVRTPNTNVMDCLNITVSSNTQKLNLDLRYITSFHDEQRAENRTISFPLNNNTENCEFSLKYGNDIVTFKILEVNKDFIFVCGYSLISPFPLFKALIREPKIDNQTFTAINNFLMDYQVDDFVHWTEHSPKKCSTAVRLDDVWLVQMSFMAVAWMLCKFPNVFLKVL